MSNIDQFQFIERGIRGDVSYICERYVKANNKYISDYDPTKPSTYITYLNANNLCGWAMSEDLPRGGFYWIPGEEIDFSKKSISWFSLEEIDSTEKGIIWDLTKKSISLDSTEKTNKGLIFEVDLDYPEYLHDKHNDYPLAPESLEIKNYMLSDYCKKFNIKVGRVKKLGPNLGPKKNYILHYKNLKQYLHLGLMVTKVTKVHRALAFDKSSWLKTYIDFNTQKRTAAESSFEKDFFKLMNNLIFGKMIENLRKRVNVTLINDPEILLKHASKPTFISSRIFNENLVHSCS